MYVIGINPTNVRTTAEGAEFELGTLGMEDAMPALQSAAIGVTGGSGGAAVPAKIYRYVQVTGGTTGPGYIVAINPATNVGVMPVAATGDAGAGMFSPVGVAQAVIPSGGFGWVQVYGPTLVRAAAAAAVFTHLAVTATPGAVDDATGATLNWVEGLILTSVASGASTVAGNIQWAYLGLKSA